jgi:membrane associated rhomboid family serine protease
MVAMEPQPAMPPAPATEYCYRHPTVSTGIHCTRCERPICTECMIPAPVGYHCPSCVEDAKREYRRGPGRRVAIADAKATSVTTLLLAAIVGMYVVEIAVGGAGSLFQGPTSNQLVKLGGAVAVWPTSTGVVGIATGQYWRLFTSMFLHAGLIHLAFNAYALWLFGTMMEAQLGRLRFTLVYLITGLFAGAVSYAFVAFVSQPNGQLLIPPVAVGASGAIFGIFGAFVAYNWRRRHTPEAAARLRMAAILIVINAVLGFGSGGAIDWHAHAGGLVAGLLVGYAAEGFGRLRDERVTFAISCAALVIATVVIALWKTAQIHQQFPQIF